ncbi:EamA family transporter [Candidatus Peregrinibacteria bacterium]|nr:EamA family transporter [Candidatus Peregrinibacteria bacterium]
MHYLLLILALVLNALANILIKIGALKMQNLSSLSKGEIAVNLITNHFLIIGVLLFAMNVVFYFLALTKINLSVAYPIMTSGGFLLITIFSVLYLRESLTLLQVMGIILIALGIFFIAYHLK